MPAEVLFYGCQFILFEWNRVIPFEVFFFVVIIRAHLVSTLIGLHHDKRTFILTGKETVSQRRYRKGKK